jgi:hypothetical protein
MNDSSQTYFCWLAARRSQARIHTLNLQTAALAITSRNLQRVHFHQSAHRSNTAKISLYPSQPHLVSTADVLKSP